MKRLISALLIISLLTVGFAGCKKKAEKEDEKKDDGKCSYCGQKIIEGTLYCIRCGEELEIDDEK